MNTETILLRKRAYKENRWQETEKMRTEQNVYFGVVSEYYRTAKPLTRNLIRLGTEIMTLRRTANTTQFNI